jgi:hypothetical protein
MRLLAVAHGCVPFLEGVAVVRENQNNLNYCTILRHYSD